jgi:hypothetical protein
MPQPVIRLEDEPFHILDVAEFLERLAEAEISGQNRPVLGGERRTCSVLQRVAVHSQALKANKPCRGMEPEVMHKFSTPAGGPRYDASQPFAFSRTRSPPI